MIRTFVFFDLETTDLIYNKLMPHITELSLVAVSRDAVLDCKDGLPRVQHKLVLPVHPKTHICRKVQSITGLTSKNLQDVLAFEHSTYDLVIHFINRLKAPVCFVAHNGNRFDYPIFLWELMCIEKVIDKSILCVDTLQFFKEFYDEKNNVEKSHVRSNEAGAMEASNTEDLSLLLEDGCDEILAEALDRYMSTNSIPRIKVKDEFSLRSLKTEPNDLNDASTSSNCDEENDGAKTPTIDWPNTMQKVNEETPKSQIIQRKNFSENVFCEQSIMVKRRLDYPSSKPQNFKLSTIYKHMLGRDPQQAHSAESDCLSMLQCVSQIGSSFVTWADDHAKPLKDKEMR